MKELKVPVETTAYMRTVVLRKTLELISFEGIRGMEDALSRYEGVENAIESFLLKSTLSS